MFSTVRQLSEISWLTLQFQQQALLNEVTNFKLVTICGGKLGGLQAGRLEIAGNETSCSIRVDKSGHSNRCQSLAPCSAEKSDSLRTS